MNTNLAEAYFNYIISLEQKKYRPSSDNSQNFGGYHFKSNHYPWLEFVKINEFSTSLPYKINEFSTSLSYLKWDIKGFIHAKTPHDFIYFSNKVESFAPVSAVTLETRDKTYKMLFYSYSYNYMPGNSIHLHFQGRSL